MTTLIKWIKRLFAEPPPKPVIDLVCVYWESDNPAEDIYALREVDPIDLHALAHFSALNNGYFIHKPDIKEFRSRAKRLGYEVKVEWMARQEDIIYIDG